MTPLLLALIGCGGDAALDQPNPPPAPPPVYATAEADVARYTGIATEIHGPTRSFVLTGEGKRVLAMLAETATLRIGGMPSQVQDLAPGVVLHVEGRREGDTLLVLRAAYTTEAEKIVLATPGTTPAAEAPAAEAPAAEAPAPEAPAPAAPAVDAPVP